MAKLEMVNRFGKRGAMAAFMASFLFAGSAAYAHNEVSVGRNISYTVRSEQLRAQADRIAAAAETNPVLAKNLSDWLYETPIHESGKLTSRRQLISKNYKVWNAKKKKWINKVKLSPTGFARSIYGVQPPTAQFLVGWAKNEPSVMSLLTTESGKTAQELGRMTQMELGQFMMQHDHFAAAIAAANTRFSNVLIPETLDKRAAYTAKYYNRGKHQTQYAAKYISDNREMANSLKAEALSRTAQKRIAPQQPTQGLVNSVLHDSKIQHAISSGRKKVSRLFNLFRRR